MQLYNPINVRSRETGTAKERLFIKNSYKSIFSKD